MDNAPYHSRVIDNPPTKSSTRSAKEQWLNDNNIPYKTNVNADDTYISSTTECACECHFIGFSGLSKKVKLPKNPLHVPEMVERILSILKDEQDMCQMELVNPTFQQFAWVGFETLRIRLRDGVATISNA